jgi:hypothetical protein
MGRRYATATAPGLGLQTSATAHYEFAPGAELVDSTGTGNTLTNINAVTFSTGTGIGAGNCANFDHSSSQNLEVSGNSTINGHPNVVSWTLNMWFNETSPGQAAYAQKGQSFSEGDWDILRFIFSPFAQISGDGIHGDNIAQSGSIAFGDWWMFTLTYDAASNSGQTYLNNISNTVTPLTFSGGPETTDPLQLGVGQGVFALGKMGIFTYWHQRILSSGDVNNLWNGGLGLSWSQMA